MGSMLLLGAGPGTGETYSAAATALFARFTTPPTTARKRAINTYIVTLQNAGVWNKLIGLYVLQAADAQAAQRNWIQDLYNASPTASPTFTADQGYAFNGSTQYLDTGCAGNLADAKWGQDNTCFGTFQRTSGTLNRATMGQASSFNCFVDPRNTAGTDSRGQVHVGAAITKAESVGNRTGLVAAYRNASGTMGLNRNGVDLGTSASTSTTRNASNFLVGAASSSFCTDQISMAFWGGHLTAAELLSLHNAHLAYVAAL
jgi:hypothetical protein